MDNTSALAYLQAEHTNNTGLGLDEAGDLQTCIGVLNETNNTLTKAQACEKLNDLYWDAPVLDQNEFGQAVFCVAYTVDPNRPFPTVRV